MYVKKGDISNNWITKLEDNKIRSQKCEIDQWKNDKREIDGETLQLYGLIKKAEDKAMNQLVTLKN